jgi:hypothetical protein
VIGPAHCHALFITTSNRIDSLSGPLAEGGRQPIKKSFASFLQKRRLSCFESQGRKS